jgi:hypothetical protein
MLFVFEIGLNELNSARAAVATARWPLDPVDYISLLKQKLSQIAAVLGSDADDQGNAASAIHRCRSEGHQLVAAGLIR